MSSERVVAAAIAGAVVGIGAGYGLTGHGQSFLYWSLEALILLSWMLGGAIAMIGIALLAGKN